MVKTAPDVPELNGSVLYDAWAARELRDEAALELALDAALTHFEREPRAAPAELKWLLDNTASKPKLHKRARTLLRRH